MSKSNQTLGLILIIIGIVGILSYFFHFNFFSMSKLWPLFILVPGLVFELSYFMGNAHAGLLVPGGILTTLGFLFLFQTYTNWAFAGYLWPVYVIAPAVGLFQLYLFGEHNRGLLIPVGILTTVAVCGFLGTSFNFISRSLIAPIVLVVAGLTILFSHPNDDHDPHNPNSPFSK